MRTLDTYTPTRFMAAGSTYDKRKADFAVAFIQALKHTKGRWSGQPFQLIDWQEQIIRDLFGTVKADGYRQFTTAYVEIPKKQGKSELAAAVALLLTCGDGEERAEVYGCAADRQQASIVFEVAADMVAMSPALSKRVKILRSVKSQATPTSPPITRTRSPRMRRRSTTTPAASPTMPGGSWQVSTPTKASPELPPNTAPASRTWLPTPWPGRSI